MRTLSFALLLLLPAAVRAAIGYERYAPPDAGFALEYPSDWKRSAGIKTVGLRPSGRDGASVKIYVELHPYGKADPKTAKEYVASLAGAGTIKKVEKRGSLDVDGRKAERVTLVETVALKDAYGAKLPGPQREAQVVVPLKTGYLVARLAGVGAAYDRVLPEFDRLVSKLSLSSAASEPKKK